MVELFFFLKRLKNWEIRERKKARDYSKETEREDERRREMVNAHHTISKNESYWLLHNFYRQICEDEWLDLCRDTNC